MSWDQTQGNWKQVKGSVKQPLGELTDVKISVIAGKRDQLAGKLKEIYGITVSEVEKQISNLQHKQKNTANFATKTKPVIKDNL